MKKTIGVIITILLAYFFLAFYYKDGFCLNTWINGVYCTGKTVEEINAELLDRIEAPIITITDNMNRTYFLDLAKVGYTVDYRSALEGYVKKQNSLLWIDNVTFHPKHEILPEIFYDEEILRTAFEELECVRKEKERLPKYAIMRDGAEGYLLYDGLSNRLDVEKAFAVLQECIAGGMNMLDLNGMYCYYDIPLTDAQKEIAQLWEKVEAFQNCDLVYDMGEEEVVLDPFRMSGFLLTENGEITLDEENNLQLDEIAVEAFVADLANTYDTYGKEWQFQSTRGDMVSVKGSTYGTEINQKVEVEFLLSSLLSEEYHSGTMQRHIPVYQREAFNRSKNEIGGTYIEVDMTEQRMYYYEEGRLKLETDIVTGNTSRRMGTPEGVNYVYDKETDRVLRGRDYASFVKYWMPVKGNYGIHDASWRNKFGGRIYQKNGSHGCINTPTDDMAKLYEMVEIGTPVVMFY